MHKNIKVIIDHVFISCAIAQNENKMKNFREAKKFVDTMIEKMQSRLNNQIKRLV